MSIAHYWHCFSPSQVTRHFQPCLFLPSLWPPRHGLIVGIECAVSEMSNWRKLMKMINIHPPVMKKKLSWRCTYKLLYCYCVPFYNGFRERTPSSIRNHYNRRERKHINEWTKTSTRSYRSSREACTTRCRFVWSCQLYLHSCTSRLLCTVYVLLLDVSCGCFI